MFEWLIGITAGLISGMITGILVALYFRHKDQIRLVFKYANQTADYAHVIAMEAKECLSGKDSGHLKELFRKPLHRNFVIKIPDTKLQEAISECNLGVGAIKCALDQNNRHQLVKAHGHMSGKLVDLWNATTEYERRERAKDEKELRCFYVVLILLLVFLVALFILFLVNG